MKLIIDTNIYISAFAFGGLPKKLIKLLAKNRNFQVFSCKKLYLELENKFLDGRMEKILGDNFEYLDALNYVRAIQKSTTFIEINVNDLKQISRDKNDDMLLYLAQKVDAKHIITGDKDLLVLESYQNTQIITVKKFLESSGD